MCSNIFIHIHCCMLIFYCVTSPQLIYPLYCGQTFGLFPVWGDCEQCGGHKHSCPCLGGHKLLLLWCAHPGAELLGHGLCTCSLWQILHFQQGQLSQSIWAAMTKYLRVHTLYTTKIYSSQFWKLASPRSKRQQIQCAVRACSQLQRRDTSHFIFTRQTGQKGSLECLYRALIPPMRAELSWPNHFPKAPPLNTVTLEVTFQYMNFGVTHIFRPQHQRTFPPKLTSFIFFVNI